MFRYKIDVMQTLKAAGFSSYRIRQERIFGQATLTKFRDRKDLPSWTELDKLCKILNYQPWNIIEYIPDGRQLPPEDQG